MDTFAQIARSGIQGRRELLESPTPAPLPDSTAVLAPCAEQPTPVPEKMRTAAQLQAALEEKRRWAAPFLTDHAPALGGCRGGCRVYRMGYRPRGRALAPPPHT